MGGRTKKKAEHFQSLQSRISRSALLVALLVFLVSYTCLYAFVYSYVSRQNNENCRIQLQQTESYVQYKVKGVIERLFYIQTNELFSKNLKKILFEENKNNGVLLGEMAGVLSSCKATEPWLSNICLYTPKGRFSDMTVLMNEGYDFKESSLYQDFLSQSSLVVWGDFYYDPVFITKRPVIPVIYRIEVDGCQEPSGLLVNLDQAKISQYISQIESPSGAFAAICTAKGEVFADSIPSDYGWIRGKVQELLLGTQEEGILRLKDNGQTVLGGWKQVHTTPWYVLYFYPEDLTGQLNGMAGALFLVNLGAASIIWFFTTKAVKRITGPMEDLAHVMETVGETDYQAAFSYEKKDEIGILTDSFNRMVENTGQYITRLKEEKEKVRIEQLLKRRAELIALQAQINPHFLYNTLDSIRWKAEEYEAEEISAMVQALATLFRIDLSRGREMIPISEELKHVSSYLSIQKYCYGDTLDYQIQVQEGLMGCYVPKIILQPLVENSIYHGLKEKDEGGTVRILGREEEGVIVFQVWDDGVGIEPKLLKRLEEGLLKGLVMNREGYGIFNVNERIRLYFGEKYGLNIENGPEAGAVVTLRMPLVREEEVGTYVSYLDSR